MKRLLTLVLVICAIKIHGDMSDIVIRMDDKIITYTVETKTIDNVGGCIMFSDDKGTTVKLYNIPTIIEIENNCRTQQGHNNEKKKR